MSRLDAVAKGTKVVEVVVDEVIVGGSHELNARGFVKFIIGRKIARAEAILIKPARCSGCESGSTGGLKGAANKMAHYA